MYYKYEKIVKSKEISRETKPKVYRIGIRSMVKYGAETMILTKDEEEKLRRFERKIVKKIYNLKRIVEGA